ncbi:MAG TPA: FAD-dependent oxidoreductase, partial [Gemmatimonadota bacterium]|nr:FAD-dependent oxidoreductase [Gemmatimonadota bacterium]
MNTEPEHYDVLVIGSGEAGKYLAWTLSKEGRRTALVEREMVGGSCPNVACLPSKNVIHSAKVASFAVDAEEFGVRVDGITISMAGVQARKRAMVEDLVGVHLSRYEASGVELIMGEARFVAPRNVEVALNDGGTRVLAGERVILSVGTRATIPDVPGMAEARPMTHVEALDLERLPDHLVVLGGGYVGLELAQAARRFGSRVTVVERGAQLAGREDPDVGAALLELFRDEDIEVLLGADLTRVEGRSGQRVRLHVETARGARIVDGSDLLIAAGRTPNTQDIGLELTGIELDTRGYAVVNDRLETSASGVWAVGDCAGSPQFTHVAFDDFRVVHD